MEFPVWHLSGFNTGLLIAVISVLHVFIAQFAVGGGIYLVWMERWAYRHNSPEILEWLERHTHFFLLVTMVFGALSGVGIWFAISVVNPGATSMLIHNFVFFWAAEWVFFFLEVVTLLAYYYTYPLSRKGLMPPRTHMRIGLVYAAAGYVSLVLINGIIAFMLTPGSGLETGNIWDGFFNPSFIPSTVFRSGIALTLAGMFALFTAPRIKSAEARRLAVRVSSLWIVFPFLILLAGSAWYFYSLPPTRHAAILRRTADINPFLIAYGWILPVVFLAGVLALVRAERLRRPLTLVILLVGLGLVGSFEWIRETARRPWVAEGYMYSNGVRLSQAEEARESGSASVSGWLRVFDSLKEAAPGGIELAETLAADLGHGSILFAQQCANCHGLGGPRIDVLDRVARLTPAGFTAQLKGEGKRLDYMPPFSGDAADRLALTNYLEFMRYQRQKGSSPDSASEAP